MDENIQAMIDELKLVVLNLHRSAGQLDEAVQKIEAGISGNSLNDKLLVGFCRLYRRDRRATCVRGRLDEREDDIWERLMVYISEQCK